MKKLLNCAKFVILCIAPTLYLMFFFISLVRDVYQEFNRLDDFNFHLYLDTFAFSLCFIFLGIASMLRVFNSTIKVSYYCKYFACIFALVYILTDTLNIINRVNASYNFENTSNFFGSNFSLQETFYIIGFLIIIVTSLLKERLFITKWILTLLCCMCFLVGLNTNLFLLINVGTIDDIRFIINQLIFVYPFIVTLIMVFAPSKVILPHNDSIMLNEKENLDNMLNGFEKIYFKSHDKQSTDWKYDFQTLPNWDRHSWAYTFDLFVEISDVDKLLCVYSVVEASMLSYIGQLAILKNKQKPELVFCCSQGIYFKPLIFRDKKSNYLFLVAHSYDKDTNTLKEPIIILDASTSTFAFFNPEGVGGFYNFVKKSENVYEFYHEGFTINRNTSKMPLIKKINIKDLKWYSIDLLNELKQILFTT